MSSVSGVMKFEQDDYQFQDETITSEESPSFITVRGVSFPGTTVPPTSDLRAEIPICFSPPGTTDAISVTAAHQFTGLPRRSLNSWAKSANPPKVSVRWTFLGQERPVFTTTLCLVADNSSGRPSSIWWIVFANSLRQEWRIACSIQQTTALATSPDTYAIYYQQQQRSPSRVLHCITCGKRITHSVQHGTTVCGYCWATTATSSESRRAASTWAPTGQGWDDVDMARQRQYQASHSILESTRRIATEAYMDSGSTQELGYAQELSQRLLAARLRRGQGIP